MMRERGGRRAGRKSTPAAAAFLLGLPAAPRSGLRLRTALSVAAVCAQQHSSLCPQKTMHPLFSSQSTLIRTTPATPSSALRTTRASPPLADRPQTTPLIRLGSCSRFRPSSSAYAAAGPPSLLVTHLSAARAPAAGKATARTACTSAGIRASAAFGRFSFLSRGTPASTPPHPPAAAAYQWRSCQRSTALRGGWAQPGWALAGTSPAPPASIAARSFSTERRPLTRTPPERSRSMRRGPRGWCPGGRAMGRYAWSGGTSTSTFRSSPSSSSLCSMMAQSSQSRASPTS